MAKQIVMGKVIPPMAFTGNETGFDVGSNSEAAEYALNGIEAISDVIQDNITGENKDHWSDDFVWHLTQGLQALTAFARQQVDLMQHELWYTHALLGDYSPEAKARALRDLKEQEKEAAS